MLQTDRQDRQTTVR